MSVLALLKLKGLSIFQLISLYRLIQTLRNSGRFSFNNQNPSNLSTMSTQEAYRILNLNPSKNLTKGINEWNHYYVRAINGEVRLWVNGAEVSGGTGCEPAQGYLCLESEGAPVEFKNIRIRILP